MKDPEGSQRWVVDEEAAHVVRRIFDMSLEGLGTFQIALALTEEKVLTPSEYAIRKGIKKAGGTAGKTHADPYHWGQSTIGKILATQEYCGDVINFKTYSVSYKNKKGTQTILRTYWCSGMSTKPLSNDPSLKQYN